VPPNRLQKRWSARLRTAGALLLLLGAVAIADYALGLASPSNSTAVFADARAPLAAGLAALAVGGPLFWLGRRWR